MVPIAELAKPGCIDGIIRAGLDYCIQPINGDEFKLRTPFLAYRVLPELADSTADGRGWSSTMPSRKLSDNRTASEDIIVHASPQMAQNRQLRRRVSDTKLASDKTPMDEVFQTVMNLIKKNLDKPRIVGPLHRSDHIMIAAVLHPSC